jgi:hypothetical protein
MPIRTANVPKDMEHLFSQMEAIVSGYFATAKSIRHMAFITKPIKRAGFLRTLASHLPDL